MKIAFTPTQYKQTGGFLKGVRNCLVIAQKVLRSILGSNANVGSSANEHQLWKEVDGVMTKVGDANTIFNEINNHLDAAHPIIVGINYKKGYPSGQHDQTSDHFVTITGRGYDESTGQYYYYYVETGHDAEHSNMATAEDNRLYYDPSTGTFKDSTGGTYRDDKYVLTHIRPNM